MKNDGPLGCWVQVEIMLAIRPSMEDRNNVSN